MRRFLVPLAAAAAALNLRAEAMGLREQVYVFKPLATLLLVALVLPTAGTSSYRRWVGLGLVACLAGDILLMLPSGLFVPGLVAFLAAHLMFIRACATDGGGLRAPKLPAVLVFAMAVGVLMYLWPSLGPMRVPVACYVFAISTMAWQMMARWTVQRSTLSAFAAVGSLSFMISDSALAVNKFATPLPQSALIIMITYYVAIWGLAWSARAEDAASR